MLTHIHHMALNVADYDASRAFYVEKLGFSVLGEYLLPNGTKRLDIQLGSVRLEIFWSETYSARPQGRLCGYRHLCLHVEDAHRAAQWLKDRGISVTEVCPDPMAGGNMAFFYDPDGLELEIHE